MRDPRQMQLAKNLIRNSVNLQKGEKVWISMSAHDPAMVTALVEQAYEAGGYPFVVLSDAKIERKLMQGMTEEQAAFVLACMVAWAEQAENEEGAGTHEGA